MKRGASDLSNSSDGTKKRKLDNWLLNLSYQHIGIYSCIVLLLCLVSFAVPVLDAVIAASGDVQACLCGCGSGGPGAPAVWYYVAAGLTGLVNVLAIISVALGIYSVAEARAASDGSTMIWRICCPRCSTCRSMWAGRREGWEVSIAVCRPCSFRWSGCRLA